MKPAIAMENSLKNFKEWKAARSIVHIRSDGDKVRCKDSMRWKPPFPGELKINVGASNFAGTEAFTVRRVFRD